MSTKRKREVEGKPVVKKESKKKEDDLERFEADFKREGGDVKTSEPDRNIDYKVGITGSKAKADKFWKWYLETILDNTGHDDDQNDKDNCIYIYGLDYTEEQSKKQKETLWKRCTCPFEIDYEETTGKFYVVFEFDTSPYIENNHRASLVTNRWIEEVMIKNFTKPFGLSLTGWFDNSHKRYTYKDNELIAVTRSKHYMSIDTNTQQ